MFIEWVGLGLVGGWVDGLGWGWWGELGWIGLDWGDPPVRPKEVSPR